MAPCPTLSRRQLMILPAAFLAMPAVHAQSTPTDTESRDVPAGMMIATILPDLPFVTSDARFHRYTLDPDAEIPARELAGAALVLLRSGNVTLTSDLPVVYRREGASGPAEAIDVPTEGITMSAGEGALVPETARMTLQNFGPEPIDLLMLEILPRLGDAGAMEQYAAGVTRQALGAGPLTFHTGPAVLIAEQVVVKPGRSAYSSTFKGVEMGGLERGQARVLCRAGMTWSTPGLLDGADLPTPGAIPVETGALLDLGTGDAYASYGGSLVWSATGEEPLVIMRAQVIPVPQPGR